MAEDVSAASRPRVVVIDAEDGDLGREFREVWNFREPLVFGQTADCWEREGVPVLFATTQVMDASRVTLRGWTRGTHRLCGVAAFVEATGTHPLRAWRRWRDAFVH